MVEVLGVGANLSSVATADEANGIEGDNRKPDAHTRWYSAAIIHYTGIGLWRVGLIPTGHNKWEWFPDLSAQDVGRFLAACKFRLCPTDEIEEKLGIRETPGSPAD